MLNNLPIADIHVNISAIGLDMYTDKIHVAIVIVSKYPLNCKYYLILC